MYLAQRHDKGDTPLSKTHPRERKGSPLKFRRMQPKGRVATTAEHAMHCTHSITQRTTEQDTTRALLSLQELVPDHCWRLVRDKLAPTSSHRNG